jgi:hypothetical protein
MREDIIRGLGFEALMQALGGGMGGDNPFGDRMPNPEDMEEMLSMMGATVKKVPKPAGQIIADARLKGKEAESSYMYKAVEGIVQDWEAQIKSAEDQKEAHRAEIENYEKRLQQVFGEARQIQASLRQANAERAAQAALIASLKELLGKGNGSKTPKIVLQARELLGITSTPAETE